jgi:hypothetical protein
VPAWLTPALHTVVILALLGAYVALWALGHQDTVLLGILGGYLGGQGVQQIATQAPQSGTTTVTVQKPGA